MNRATIPTRMQKLPRDKRGIPIPAGVWIDSRGEPQFTINDEEKRQRHIREDRCPICGDTLFRGRWFIGGPASAFHPMGAYIDPPAHAECAHYALVVCPYLAAPSYGRRIDDRKVPPGDPRPIMVDPTMLPDRPELFVALMATGQTLVMEGPLVRYVKPKEPYRTVEFWRHGEQVEESEALQLMRREIHG